MKKTCNAFAKSALLMLACASAGNSVVNAAVSEHYEASVNQCLRYEKAANGDDILFNTCNIDIYVRWFDRNMFRTGGDAVVPAGRSAHATLGMGTGLRSPTFGACRNGAYINGPDGISPWSNPNDRFTCRFTN